MSETFQNSLIKDIKSGSNSFGENLEDLADFVSHHDEVKKLCDLLGHTFQKNELILKALVHSSFQNEWSKISLENNERLELLGDGVLTLIVLQELYHLYPHSQEGELSQLKAYIISKKVWYQLACWAKFDRCLLIGRGVESGHMSIMADTFEAIWGAIYLDCGDFSKMSQLFQGFIKKYKKFSGIDIFHRRNLDSFDYKSQLQREVLSRFKIPPCYKAEEKVVSGKRIFQVSLYINHELRGTLEGHSKRELENKLAHKCLLSKSF